MGIEIIRNFNLDEKSPVPLYHQLKEIMKESIEIKKFKPGDKLPSERELAEIFKINRLTVRQAMNELVNEGALVRKRGLGTYVAPPKLLQGLLQLTSFTEDMEKRGLKPWAKLLSIETINSSEKVAKALKIVRNEPVIKLARLRLADNEPMALETSHLPHKIFPGLEEHKEHIAFGSLYELLEREYKAVLWKAQETMEASIANRRECELLNIQKGAPVLLRERITLNDSGVPVEYVKSIYRADRYKFHLELVSK